MKFRMISATMLALVVGLAVLAPAPALGQSGTLYVATDVGVFVPATDNQLIRVTIGNPNRPEPVGDGHFRESSFSIELDGPATPVTIGPGESYTYVLDPREVGVPVEQRSVVRSVSITFTCTVQVSAGRLTPHPSLTIEIVNRKTGVVESFHAFPGFNGGVVVAS